MSENDDTPYCINGCGRIAVTENLLGVNHEYEVVELVCYETTLGEYK